MASIKAAGQNARPPGRASARPGILTRQMGNHLLFFCWPFLFLFAICFLFLIHVFFGHFDGNGMTLAKVPKKGPPQNRRFCLRWRRTFHESPLGTTPRPHIRKSLNNMVLRACSMGSQFFPGLVLTKLQPQLSAKKGATPKWAILP